MAIQEKMEKNIWGMIIMLLIVLSVGGIVEIVPLFYIDKTFEHNKYPEIVWKAKAGQTLNDHKPGDGVRPYKALELAGRDIYQREGCYLCHSQMIRPIRYLLHLTCCLRPNMELTARWYCLQLMRDWQKVFRRN